MNKKLMTCLCLLIIISLTGCGRRNNVETVIIEEERIIPVTVASVENSILYQSVFAIGEVSVSEVYQVTADVQGTVEEVYFEVGEHVSKGDVLFKINMNDFEVEMQNKLSQGRNTVKQAKLNYDNAVESLEKTQKLFDSGVASKLELDKAETTHDNAKISYENSLDAYETLTYNYESNLDRFQVVSPVDGTVSSKNVLKGMQVTMQTGYTIDSDDGLTIQAQIPSKYINSIEENQTTTIFVPATDGVYTGYVTEIAQQGKNGIYRVTIVIDQETSNLLAGMFSNVIVKTSDEQVGLWVPSQVIVTEQGENYVYVAEDNQAKKVKVNILNQTGDLTAIESEITVKDQVILYGKDYLVDGSKIKIGE